MNWNFFEGLHRIIAKLFFPKCDSNKWYFNFVATIPNRHANEEMCNDRYFCASFLFDSRCFEVEEPAFRRMLWIKVLISPTFSKQIFILKCFAQLFSNYSLSLSFFGKRILAQKLLIKFLWNWPKEKRPNVKIPWSFYLYN